MQRVIFQYGQKDGVYSVTIGRWNAVPTGPWCAWNAPELASYGQDKRACTAPRLTARGGSWWRATVDPTTGVTWCSLYEHAERSTRQIKTPRFATPEDHWSITFNDGKVKGPRTRDAWREQWSFTLLPKADSDGICRDDSSKLMWRLRGRALDEIDDLATLLAALGAPPRVLDLLDTCKHNTAHWKEQAGAQAKATRAQNAARKDKGGNPRRFEMGDVVLHGEPVTYGGTPQRVFHYVPNAAYPDGPAAFYAYVNEDGYGVGPRYLARKNRLYKACLAAFDAIAEEHPRHIPTAHERLHILQLQKTAEVHKARWKAEAKAAQAAQARLLDAARRAATQPHAPGATTLVDDIFGHLDVEA